jgi:hypothetical protein
MLCVAWLLVAMDIKGLTELLPSQRTRGEHAVRQQRAATRASPRISAHTTPETATCNDYFKLTYQGKIAGRLAIRSFQTRANCGVGLGLM